MRSGKQAASPLVQALVDYTGVRRIPFHTPGHKQGRGLWGPWRDLLRTSVAELDLTELPGLDDLHQPEGAIKTAQELAAACFGAEATYFLVNGATAGVQAMLLAANQPGDAVLVPRNCHQSVYAGLVLSGAIPVYIRSAVHPRLLFPLGPNPDELKDRLRQTAPRSIIWVYPTYHGIVSDLKQVIDLVAGSPGPDPAAAVPDDVRPLLSPAAVLVDEAHGPHFCFHQAFPATAMELGADVSVQGTHKLLGAMTQSALLHWRQGKIERAALERALRLLQSTSPSYILMASLDAARRHMEEEGSELLERTLQLADWVRAEINAIPGMYCPGAELVQLPGVSSYDPTKLVISGLDLGLTGFELGVRLAQQGIVVELAEWGAVLALLTIADSMESVRALVEALRVISRSDRPRFRPQPPLLDGLELVPPMVLTPREAYFRSSRAVRLEASCGQVAAEMVAPYPPGIPLLYPGERIIRETVAVIQGLTKQGVRFHGPVDSTLETIRVIGGDADARKTD